MLFRIFISLLIGFYSVIGLSVNFRKEDKHNPFILSLWGYVLVVPCIVLTLISVYLQYKDNEESKLEQIKAEQRIFRDSISQQQLVANVYALNAQISDQKESIDSVYSQNRILSAQNRDLHGDGLELFKQNVDLLKSAKFLQNEIALKNMRIEYLEKSVHAAKQGNTKSISFEGLIRRGGASANGGFGTSVSEGLETKYYSKISDAIKKGNPYVLIRICDEGIKLSPDWMTPYFIKGQVLYQLGLKDDGLDYLKTVEDNTIGDPDFTQKLINFYIAIGEKQKALELKNTFHQFH